MPAGCQHGVYPRCQGGVYIPKWGRDAAPQQGENGSKTQGLETLQRNLTLALPHITAPPPTHTGVTLLQAPSLTPPLLS